MLNSQWVNPANHASGILRIFAANFKHHLNANILHRSTQPSGCLRPVLMCHDQKESEFARLGKHGGERFLTLRREFTKLVNNKVMGVCPIACRKFCSGQRTLLSPNREKTAQEPARIR